MKSKCIAEFGKKFFVVYTIVSFPKPVRVDIVVGRHVNAGNKDVHITQNPVRDETSSYNRNKQIPSLRDSYIRFIILSPGFTSGST